MAAGDWEFVWAGPMDSVRYALPCIDERKISFKLNQPGTCELTIPIRTDVGRHIATGLGWGYILAYKGGTLRMVLETVSTDVGPASTEGIPSIAIVGTESPYLRAAAVIPSALAPFQFPTSSGQIGTHLVNLISPNVNSWGIDVDFPGVTPTVGASTMEQGMDLLSLIQAFAFRGSGFDFRFNPVFTMVAPALIITGSFQPAGVIGLSRPNCVFEFGAGTKANLTSYSWKRLGGDHLANLVFVPSNGSSVGLAAGVASAGDLTSTLTYGSRARWVTADFEDHALRTSLAQEHVAYRKQPRRILSITPNADMGLGNVPTPLTDYGIGDILPVTIKDDGVTLVSGNVRVYGLSFTIDKDGKETVEIETSPETA